MENLVTSPCTAGGHVASGNTPPHVLNLVLGESGQFHAPAVLPSVISSFIENPYEVFSSFVGEQAGG